MSRDVLPRIGVSACLMHPDPTRAFFKGKTLLYAEESLLRWVQNAGAFPVVIPRPVGKVDTLAIVSALDGVLLQGGADVAPENYGEAPARPEWCGDAVRDTYELAVVRACLELDRPVLGVCRGVQLLNVALGGSLFQDVETMHPGQRVHRAWEVYDRHGHDVAFEHQSFLGRVYGRDQGRVNSVHHQAVKELGRGLVVEARSMPDGVVEAVRFASPDSTCFALGVQWHPEFMQDTRPEAPDQSPPPLPPEPLMAAFLAEVEQRRARRDEEQARLR